MIEWTDGYRYAPDGTTGESAGKSATDTYIPIAGGHVYTVLCGAGGTANRYGHVYRQDKTRIESVNESKAAETFTFTATANAAWFRYTCNTDAKTTTYVHDDTDDKYIVKNGRVLP